QRAGENLPHRIDDAASAANRQFWQILRGVEPLWRIRISRQILTTAEHEATTLARNVPHCRNPALAVVDGRRAVELDTLPIHRHSRERHVVFPADQRAEFADR